MAQDYTTSKTSTVSQLRQISANILDLIALARKITQEAIDIGFAPGTPTTGITDADLQTGTPPIAPQLAAADITAAVAAINSIDTQLASSSRAGYKALEKMR